MVCFLNVPEDLNTIEPMIQETAQSRNQIHIFKIKIETMIPTLLSYIIN